MRIGLTFTGMDWKHENYVRWLRGHDAGLGGETPTAVEVIKLTAGGDPETLKTCDGLVLSGGIDMDPAAYGGGEDYPEKTEIDKGRDVFEQSLCKFALEQGMPILGVCRGLQLINVCLKGNLFQDLGVEGNQIHKGVKGQDKEHGVRIEEGSFLNTITECVGGWVNSAHHQAIDRLGEGLIVNCRAEDGTIEGIEWADPAGKPFMLAVQWHPERMYINHFEDSRLYEAIRDCFVNEIRRIKKKV
jgi:putative glutamine amidotransferase